MHAFRFLVIAALLSLAACARSSSGFVPGGASPGSLQAPQAKGPQFSITIVLPKAVSPRGTTAYVASLKATTYVGRKRYIDVVNASIPCAAGDGAGTFGGCGIALDGTASYQLKRATFVFYKKTGAKGCALAQGELKAVGIPPGPVAVTMKPVNKKTCW